jgi:hypothetical protein
VVEHVIGDRGPLDEPGVVVEPPVDAQADTGTLPEFNASAGKANGVKKATVNR